MLHAIAAGGTDRSLSPADRNEPKIGPRVSGANGVGLGLAQGEVSRSRTDDRRLKHPAIFAAKHDSVVGLDGIDGHGKRPSRAKAPHLPQGGLKGHLPLKGVELGAAEGPSAGPASNRHTHYLGSLLRYRRLRLILEPKETRQRAPLAKIYDRWVSDAGLLINDIVHEYANLPMLRLPRTVKADERLLAADGSLDRVAHGSLLEDVWSELGIEAKHDIARQLRRLVDQMRKTPQPSHHGEGRLVGSAFSSTYSLMLDKRQNGTEWVIRSAPTQREFIAFLIKTVDSSVPEHVAASIAAQFRLSGPLVLSHSELSPQNIIVNEGKIVAIIGWDCAGWYPEWWDYVKFFEARTQWHDWYDYVGDIFQRWFQGDLMAYQALMRCRRP